MKHHKQHKLRAQRGWAEGGRHGRCPAAIWFKKQSWNNEDVWLFQFNFLDTVCAVLCFSTRQTSQGYTDNKTQRNKNRRQLKNEKARFFQHEDTNQENFSTTLRQTTCAKVTGATETPPLSSPRNLITKSSSDQRFDMKQKHLRMWPLSVFSILLNYCWFYLDTENHSTAFNVHKWSMPLPTVIRVWFASIALQFPSKTAAGQRRDI